MTSQSQIEDEILAKRLQSEEFQAAQGHKNNNNNNHHHHNRAQNTQLLNDEELARRLALEERQRSERRVVVSAVPATNKPVVKLHQTATGRQIGETLIVNSFGPEEIAFELGNRRGYFLKIRDTGTVEFNVPPSGIIDDFFRFRVFKLSNGSCYLMNKAFLQSTNRAGGRGWHLTILPNGQLCGNGTRDNQSEWALVNVQTDIPLFHPAAGMSSMTSASTLPSQTPAPTQFPGLGAGKDELMKYFSTPAGIQFLNQPEYLPAYQLYQRNGLLSRLLHRPDWPFLASKFRDYFNEPLPFQREIVDHFTPFDSLKQFFESGWTTVSNVVTPEAINNAKKIINYWKFKYLSQPPSGFNGIKKSRGYHVELTGDIAWDMDLLSLYYLSPLPHIMQQLTGAGEVEHPKFCRAVSIYPSLDLTDSPTLYGDKWTIEGFTANPPSHSPYNILIGIALTNITDTDMGNFCVHSGSHVVLLEEYKNKAEQRQTLFSENPYSVQKPDLGLPTQLKLKAGDAFFCTQRLATLLANNTRSDQTVYAFFEISHVDHAVLKDPALQSMWLEYKNATFYLGDQNAGIIVTPAEATAVARDADLIDFSDINISMTAANASAVAYPSLGYQNNPNAPPVNAPLVRTPSQQQRDEDYAPAINPMFGQAGWQPLPTEGDEVNRDSVGPVRPSNHIQLHNFSSSSK